MGASEVHTTNALFVSRAFAALVGLRRPHGWLAHNTDGLQVAFNARGVNLSAQTRRCVGSGQVRTYVLQICVK